MIKEIPSPVWAKDRINYTQLDISPADLCILSTRADDTGMSTTWCQNCSAGFFQARIGSTFCEWCPVDTYSSSNGSTACYSCPAESHIYQPAGGPTIPQISVSQCQSNCPPGTYAVESNEWIQSSCMPCIPGSFSAERDAKSCLPCELGKFSPQFAAQKCVLCPVGKSTEAVGSNRSEQCLGTAQKILFSPECTNQDLIVNFNGTWSDEGFVDTNHSSILKVTSSPLHRLQQRLLGTADIKDKNIDVKLDQAALQDENQDQRLFWFLQQATGLNRLNLQNSSCYSRERVGGFSSENPNPVSRVFHCTGKASVWGYSKFTTDLRLRTALPDVLVVFVEVNKAEAAPILHMGLFLLDYNQSERWSPFRYTGLPIFDGIPKDSWVHNLGFGGNLKPLNILIIQASTFDFQFSGCEICTRSIDLADIQFMSQSKFLFKRGFAFYAQGVHIRMRTDFAFQLLGLEKIMKQVFIYCNVFF